MILYRSNVASLTDWPLTVVRLLLAFSVVCLCLQSVVGPPVAQGKNAPFPIVHIPSQSTSVAARLANQNALFKAQSEDDLRASPESATARGDYRDNALLDDYSL